MAPQPPDAPAAPFEGEILIECPPEALDFRQTFAVVVSGATWNPCGHVLLKAGDWYLHVAGGVRAYPRFMDEAGYARYLADHGKKELARYRVAITDPDGAMTKLMELLAEKWTWGVLPHNCSSFVEEVVAAGGSSADLLLNCPAIEVFD